MVTTFQTKLNGLTIGMLKKIISDIPDAIEKMLKEHVTKRVDYKHKTVIRVFEKKQA